MACRVDELSEMPEDRINDPPAPVHADAPAPDYATTSHLMLFFALVYVVEGVGQIGGLIAQPLTYYLRCFFGACSTKGLLNLGIALGTVTIAAYLPLFNEVSAWSPYSAAKCELIEIKAINQQCEHDLVPWQGSPKSSVPRVAARIRG